MSPLELLLGENPSLQSWPGGQPANWSVAPQVLRFIAESVLPGMTTLETGSGQTTIAFAIAGAEHTAITLDPGEEERIRRWCSRNNIDARLSFLHESSDVALPLGSGIPAALDFVFIDGAHRFPFLCLDFHYTEARLKVGGISGIDDIHMPSVRLLHDFLADEDEWSLVEILGKTSFFRRMRETVVINDCQGQRINQVRPWLLPDARTTATHQEARPTRAKEVS